MTQYAFHFDGTRCTGCKTCEMACKDFKDLTVGTAFRKVYEVTLGTTERDANGCITSSCVSYPLSMSCNHCEDPACTKVCPTTAMHKDAETGLVSVDVDKCIGCGYCHMACPYNAPKVDREKGHSVKCDGCAERVAAGRYAWKHARLARWTSARSRKWPSLASAATSLRCPSLPTRNRTCSSRLLPMRCPLATRTAKS